MRLKFHEGLIRLSSSTKLKRSWFWRFFFFFKEQSVFSTPSSNLPLILWRSPLRVTWKWWLLRALFNFFKGSFTSLTPLFRRLLLVRRHTLHYLQIPRRQTIFSGFFLKNYSTIFRVDSSRRRFREESWSAVFILRTLSSQSYCQAWNIAGQYSFSCNSGGGGSPLSVFMRKRSKGEGGGGEVVQEALEKNSCSLNKKHHLDWLIDWLIVRFILFYFTDPGNLVQRGHPSSKTWIPIDRIGSSTSQWQSGCEVFSNCKVAVWTTPIGQNLSGKEDLKCSWNCFCGNGRSQHEDSRELHRRSSISDLGVSKQ